MKKKNGFTLIELLAVIVILAIIVVIATPLTINVINKSKEKTFINSVYVLIDEARLLSAEQLFKDETNEVVVQFQEGVSDNTNFKVSGDLPNTGTVYLNLDGNIELKVWNEEIGKCAEKSANESEVKLTETTKENCKIKICPLVTIMGKNIRTCDTKTNDPDNNLRYVGPNPNNYIWFNKNEEGKKERWRIIGVFHDEEKGDQIKIIRDEPYNNRTIAWDDDSDGSKTNNWETASLNALFNDKNTGYIKTIQTNDPDSYEYIDLNHVWNIGGTTNYNSSTRSDFYTVERSDTKSSAMTGHLWEGAIGLMYPSDYGYAASGTAETCNSVVMYNWRASKDETAFTECAKKSWLYDKKNYQWTLTIRSDYTNRVFFVVSAGYVNYYLMDNNLTARPVLYLKSDTKIIGGQGTYNQPFELGV